MMENFIIKVPRGLRDHKISNWQGFENQFNPAHQSYILNKQITGCGATTYYLENNEPVILCSHRNLLLSTKADNPRHKGMVHLFKRAEDSTAEDLHNNMARLHQYLNSCQQTPFSQGRIPKILVTADSLCHVYDVLRDLGLVDQFTVVSDECQCLITDAPFKHESLLSYTQYLREFRKVIFISATPLEKYLAMFPPEYSPIGQLPYYELQWPEDEVCKPVFKVCEVRSLTRAAIDIVEKYREDGYFEKNAYDTATQAVFFLNSVKGIRTVLNKTKLSPDEVNIICANTKENRAALRINGVQYEVGTAPQEGDPHKTFTFVTKCSFEGTDFFHTNAYTYIFANPNLDNLLLDVSSDVQQILGRQRLDSNPWKNYATMFTLAPKDGHNESLAEFYDRVKDKDAYTMTKIREYEQADELGRRNKIEENRSMKNGKIGYSIDYLEFVKDPNTGEAIPIPNFSVKACEQRAFDIRSGGFVENLYLYANDRQQCNTNPVLRNLEDIMASTGSFQYKMKCYVEFRQNYPQHESEFLSSISIDPKYHQYYNEFGPDRIRALSYQEHMLLDERKGNCYYNDALKIAVLSVFHVGDVYSNSEAKAMLGGVYESLGINRSAKATTLNAWFGTSRVRVKGVESVRIDSIL